MTVATFINSGFLSGHLNITLLKLLLKNQLTFIIFRKLITKITGVLIAHCSTKRTDGRKKAPEKLRINDQNFACKVFEKDMAAKFQCVT
jgi:hypothetical protein